MHFEKHKVT